MAANANAIKPPVCAQKRADPGKWCVISAVEAQTTPVPAQRGRHTGRWAAAIVVALFLALLAYGLASKGTDDRIDRALEDGKAPAAPSFSLEVLERGSVPPGRPGSIVDRSLRDGKVTLSELRGVPVVVNLWASWCRPCRAESKPLEEASREWGGRGVAFIGLDIQDLRGDARRFMREQGLTYPSLRDSGRETADRYGATGIPETFFIDRRGHVVGHVVGAANEEQLRLGSRAALTGEVVGRSSGGASFDVR
jgi:cytochrome c biogenesis protein CcmG/thiol:disulfide interchange protein DsbE